MDLSTIIRILFDLVSSLPMTLALAAMSVPLSFLVALGLTILRRSSLRVLRMSAEGYVLVFRSTPLLVQIFILYYGLSQFAWLRASILWGILREPFWCAVIAISLCSGAYAAEVIRGALNTVPTGCIEAARALGLSRFQTILSVTAPIALRQALPAYSSEIIITLKATSLACTITVMELTGTAKNLMGETFAVIEVFTIAALIYLTLTTLMILLLQRLERSFSIPQDIRSEPQAGRPKPGSFWTIGQAGPAQSSCFKKVFGKISAERTPS
jgi:octopine/nopaline transport system permease protein